MKSVVLVKIGGSLITDKNKPFTLNPRALAIIVKEIKKVRAQTNKLLILGHGAGSFGHTVAKKYDTVNGAKSAKDVFGLAKVADSAIELNRYVVKALLAQKLPAVSLSPCSNLLANNKQFKQGFFKTLKQLLKLSGLPVVYGDVVLDTTIGATIFSTEKVLAAIGQELQTDPAFKVEQIIHCGQTVGVYDQDGQTIPLINSRNFNQIKPYLNGSHGVDVTGGMIHKVEESLKLAQQGIPALIIDGIEQGSLSRAIKGQSVPGTRVEA